MGLFRWRLIFGRVGSRLGRLVTGASFGDFFFSSGSVMAGGRSLGYTRGSCRFDVEYDKERRITGEHRQTDISVTWINLHGISKVQPKE